MKAPAPPAGLPPESEEEFQAQVIALAHLHGWRVAHFRRARTARGWRTAVQADGKGFPDLVLARPGRLLFAEVKSNAGRLSPEQIDWYNALVLAGADVYLWRPMDWDEIVRTLGT